MIFNYTTIDTIIERINRKPIAGVQWNPEEIKEYAGQALDKIGVKLHNIYLTKIIEIEDGKALLPSNLIYIDLVKDKDTGYELYPLDVYEEFVEMSYKINNGFIFTDFESGTIEMFYYSYATDDKNRPLIPDNEYYLSAVESYIRFQIGEKGYWQNLVLENQLRRLEQEWYFYVNSAKNSTRMISSDQMKKIMFTPFPKFK